MARIVDWASMRMQGRTLMLNDRIKSTGDLERALVLVERTFWKCPNEVAPTDDQGV